MDRVVWVCGLLCLLGLPGWADAQTKWKTQQALLQAREALSLGVLKRWKKALEAGDAAYAKERSKMPLHVRKYMGMWLNLLWSKYYERIGVVPPVRDIGSFKSKESFQAFIRAVRIALDAQRKALGHLQNYNKLYSEVSDRSKVRSQVYLQASLSMARTVRERVRIVRVYLSLLRYAEQHWGKDKKIKARLQQQDKTITQLKYQQMKTGKSLDALKQKRQRLATSVKRADDLYVKLERKRKSSSTTSAWLVGIGLAGVGVGLVGAGGLVINYFVAHAGTSATDQDLSIRYLIYIAPVFGAVAVGGLVMAIIGWNINPGGPSRSVIRSHHKYLDYERNKRNQSSRLLGQGPMPLALLPGAQPSQPVVVLGVW